MQSPPSRDLSVILVVQRDSELLRRVLRDLQKQSVASRLECVLVTRSATDLTDVSKDALGGALSVRSVEAGHVNTEGGAKAAGVSAARAPLVAFLEDHTFPDPTWAENLLQAHRRDEFAVVGPVVHNANPTSGASWGCFLVYYGPYTWARAESEIEHLPANHSSYRRDLLLDYGSRLPDMLEAEAILHQDLLARGHRLFQEPSAKVYHLNYSRLGPSLREYFLASRVFAARRAVGWGGLRRAVYTLGSPILPLLRPLRVFRYARSAGLERSVVWRAMLTILLTFSAGAAGEMLGYGVGAGRAEEKLLQFEAERDKVFSPRDLEEARRLPLQAANPAVQEEP